MNSARKTKLKLKHHKPHNPLVVSALQRKAGSHRKSGKGLSPHRPCTARIGPSPENNSHSTMVCDKFTVKCTI